MDQVDDEADREVGIVADAVAADREVGIVANAVAADLTRPKADGKKEELARVQNHRAEKHEDGRVQTRVGERSREKKDDLDRDPEAADPKKNRLLQSTARRLAQSHVCDRNHQLKKKPSNRVLALARLRKDESAPVPGLDLQVWIKRERKHGLALVLDLDRTHDNRVYKTAIYHDRRVAQLTFPRSLC